MVQLVSGAGGGGTSYLPLGGGAPLGPDGARRLAGLLREARPPLLTRLDLRCCDIDRAVGRALGSVSQGSVFKPDLFHGALPSFCGLHLEIKPRLFLRY